MASINDATEHPAASYALTTKCTALRGKYYAVLFTKAHGVEFQVSRAQLIASTEHLRPKKGTVDYLSTQDHKILWLFTTAFVLKKCQIGRI